MPFHIRDHEADALVRKLAALKGVSLTDAVKIAAANELARSEEHQPPLRERIKVIQDRLAKYEPTGLVADKAFFDELSGDV